MPSLIENTSDLDSNCRFSLAIQRAVKCRQWLLMSFLGKVIEENINFCGKKMIFYFYSSSMNKFHNFVLISKSCQNSCSSQRIKNILYSCQSLKKISSTAENSLQTESFSNWMVLYKRYCKMQKWKDGKLLVDV